MKLLADPWATCLLQKVCLRSHQLGLEGNCNPHNCNFSSQSCCLPHSDFCPMSWFGTDGAIPWRPFLRNNSPVNFITQVSLLSCFPTSCGAAGSALSKGKLYGEVFGERSTPVLGAAGEELGGREISSPSISCASNPTLPLKCLFLDDDNHGLSVCIIIWMDGGGEDISDHGIQLACFKYRRSTFILNVQLRCLRVFLLNTFKLYYTAVKLNVA